MSGNTELPDATINTEQRQNAFLFPTLGAFPGCADAVLDCRLTFRPDDGGMGPR